jgi:hypothetical protein
MYRAERMLAANEEIPQLDAAISKAFMTSSEVAKKHIQRVKVDELPKIPMVCWFIKLMWHVSTQMHRGTHNNKLPTNFL